MASLVKEVASVRSFLEARASVCGGASIDSVVQGFTDALIKQIGQCATFQPTEAAQLATALRDSPYGEHGTKRIMEAIDVKLKGGQARSSTGDRKSVKGEGAKSQYLKCWWSYCTEADWAIFHDPKKSFHTKMA